MSSQNQPPNVQTLFQGAHNEGDLSAAAFATLSVPDLGAQIQAALGTPALRIPTSRVVLVNVLGDDSGSIARAGNEPVLRECYNDFIGALRGARAAGDVMVTTSFLNAGLLHPYVMIADAPVLDASNYRATGGTPLYDQTIVSLGSVIAKTREFEDAGVPVNSITLVFTDGHDEHSRRTVAEVRPIMEDVVNRESHIVAGIGISDGFTDFGKVFRDMGLRAEWIMTPGNDPKHIRAVFGLFSASAAQASQSGASFSQVSQSGLSTAAGGFGAP
jgi:hypothetical protein